MTEHSAPRPEEAAGVASSAEHADQEKPVVRDRRRIDPETGKARAVEEPAPADGTDQAADGTDQAADGAGHAADGADQPGETAAEADTPAPDSSQGGALAQAKAEAAEAAEELARRNADLYNLQQEYNAYVRRSKSEAAAHRQAGAAEVAEALMGVLDEIQLAREHGDLTGPFQAIAEKLESTLAQRFGVERFGAVGEEFDPTLHEALMHNTDPEAVGVTVSQVLQPGYRIGERVLRAARVATSSAE